MSIKNTISRDIHDLKIARLLTDVGPDEATDPNTLTFSTLRDFPGVASLSLTVEFEEDQLRGDGQELDVYTKPNAVTGSITGLMEFQVIRDMLGGRLIEDPGATTGKRIFRYSSQDATEYFYLQAQIRPHNSAGDIHVRLWKVRLTGLTLEYAQQTYAQINMDFRAIGTFYEWTNPDDSTDKAPLFFDLEQNDVRVPITAVAPLVYA